ncbi:MAG: hypothetical protein QNJ51_05285 [Calothrix sp. MO_167.B12]|nr:hypothetical protein [Calothrix sp. MO_167.B12]
MTVEQSLTKLFQMSDEVWEHHANPWSVWTRYSGLPILVLSIWSRVWMGIWCLIPVAVSLFWIWINPRIFSKPQSTNNWASKAVLGERVWLNRQQIPIPAHHQSMANILTTISAVGTVMCIWGLIQLAPWLTVLGMVVTILGKSWFLDRMVWLFEDMKNADANYRSWLY